MKNWGFAGAAAGIGVLLFLLIFFRGGAKTGAEIPAVPKPDSTTASTTPDQDTPDTQKDQAPPQSDGSDGTLPTKAPGASEISAMRAVFPDVDPVSGRYLGDGEGHPVTDGRYTRVVHLFQTEEGEILVTATEVEDGCHACAGALSAFYLKKGEASRMEINHRYPNFVELGSWGKADEATPIALPGTSVALRFQGGYTAQGQTCSGTTIWGFQSDGPKLLLPTEIDGFEDIETTHDFQGSVDGTVAAGDSSGYDLTIHFLGNLTQGPYNKIIDTLVGYRMIDGKLKAVSGENPITRVCLP